MFYYETILSSAKQKFSNTLIQTKANKKTKQEAVVSHVKRHSTNTEKRTRSLPLSTRKDKSHTRARISGSVCVGARSGCHQSYELEEVSLFAAHSLSLASPSFSRFFLRWHTGCGGSSQRNEDTDGINHSRLRGLPG